MDDSKNWLELIDEVTLNLKYCPKRHPQSIHLWSKNEKDVYQCGGELVASEGSWMSRKAHTVFVHDCSGWCNHVLFCNVPWPVLDL